MAILILLILLVIVTINYIGQKIAATAMILYIKDHEIPSEEELWKYTEKAFKQLFHLRDK